VRLVYSGVLIHTALMRTARCAGASINTHAHTPICAHASQRTGQHKQLCRYHPCWGCHQSGRVLRALKWPTGSCSCASQSS